jgi:hypothetical protein
MQIENTDPGVDKYIDNLPTWQKTICQELRKLIHLAEPDIAETVKFTDRPYFVFNGNVCAFLAAKTHVNLFIYDPIAPDPEGIINQGRNNQTARSIQIKRSDVINSRAIVSLIRAVAQNNRAGGWRKIQKTK